tara:strand:- start:2664 stop:3188 length:525 start_codon:yes stop_codon:yes gene_type:complete
MFAQHSLSRSQPCLVTANAPEQSRRTKSDTEIDIGEWGQFVDLENYRNLYGKRKIVKYQGGHMRTYVQYNTDKPKWYLENWRSPISSLLNYFISSKKKDSREKHMCETIKEETSELKLTDSLDSKDDTCELGTESTLLKKEPSYAEAFPLHKVNTGYIVIVAVISMGAFALCLL